MRAAQYPRVGTNQGFNAFLSNSRFRFIQCGRLGVELVVPYRGRAEFIYHLEGPAADITTANFYLDGFSACTQILA